MNDIVINRLVEEYGVEEIYSSAIEGGIFEVFMNLYSSKHKYTPYEGYTLIHLAVVHNNLEVLKFLANEGCDLNAGDVDGLTALHFAVISKSNKCFDYLLSHPSVDIAAKTNDGNTFLHYAAMVNNMYVAMHRDRHVMRNVFNMKNNAGKYCGELLTDSLYSNGVYSANLELFNYSNTVAPEGIKIKYKKEGE